MEHVTLHGIHHTPWNTSHNMEHITLHGTHHTAWEMKANIGRELAGILEATHCFTAAFFLLR